MEATLNRALSLALVVTLLFSVLAAVALTASATEPTRAPDDIAVQPMVVEDVTTDDDYWKDLLDIDGNVVDKGWNDEYLFILTDTATLYTIKGTEVEHYDMMTLLETETVWPNVPNHNIKFYDLDVFSDGCFVKAYSNGSLDAMEACRTYVFHVINGNAPIVIDVPELHPFNMDYFFADPSISIFQTDDKYIFAARHAYIWPTRASTNEITDDSGVSYQTDYFGAATVYSTSDFISWEKVEMPEVKYNYIVSEEMPTSDDAPYVPWKFMHLFGMWDGNFIFSYVSYPVVGELNQYTRAQGDFYCTSDFQTFIPFEVPTPTDTYYLNIIGVFGQNTQPYILVLNVPYNGFIWEIESYNGADLLAIDPTTGECSPLHHIDVTYDDIYFFCVAEQGEINFLLQDDENPRWIYTGDGGQTLTATDYCPQAFKAGFSSTKINTYLTADDKLLMRDGAALITYNVELPGDNVQTLAAHDDTLYIVTDGKLKYGSFSELVTKATGNPNYPDDPHTHNYTDEITPPTCSEQGYTTHTCACGDSYVDSYVDALGHSTVIDEAVAPTCTATGLTAGSHCSVCNTVLTAQSEVAALGHAWDDGVITKKPTTVSDGVKAYTCARCKETKAESIDKLLETVDVTKEFTDVKDTWYTEAVSFAVNNGLFGGMGNKKFAPQTAMTRAMLVTVLWRLDGELKPTGSNSFTDVKAGQWYTTPVIWAAENEIVTGVGNSKFNPNGNVTREQIAAIMYRYANYKKYDTAARADLSKYPDVGKASGWATEALAWANAEGLINGTAKNGKDYLDPQGNATRAQVAAILMRYVVNVEK